ncbi:probable helicase with zinc finger domain [Callorhinchus milii]|uniref:probable helicase with zinc finger domain n=1 Tax=Callorhinchus milii TaxID=7868 RepID=UPI0004574A65|nr:probable helicase with zinc finger domain [Callorhinchus milii]|eukprot:gi/632974971/ref/XP_007903968.1/ PREDICTED: probable helicase with zinc finger domain [Callorhinchus milii]
MAERRTTESCDQACEQVWRQEYKLALYNCKEGLPLTSHTGFPTSASVEAVRLQALLYRISCLIRLKNYKEAEEDCKSVLWMHEVLGENLLRDVLAALVLEGKLKEVFDALCDCKTADCMNGVSLNHLRRLVHLLADWQASTNNALFSSEQDTKENDCRWKFRPPPRGVVGIDEYSLCCRYLEYGACHFEDLCVFAHSDPELVEWRERHAYRQLQYQQQREQQQGTSYSEKLIEKWLNNPSADRVVSRVLEGVRVESSRELNQVSDGRTYSFAWIFSFTCNPPRLLHQVAFLSNSYTHCFHIASIAAGDSDSLHPYSILPHCQEWSRDSSGQNRIEEHSYQIAIKFYSQVFGNFQQTILFDFGSEPVLMQTVTVSAPSDKAAEALSHHQQQSLTTSQRWEATCKQIVEFRPQELSDLDLNLLVTYQIPAAADQLFTRSVLDKVLNRHNYHSRFHDLLYIEENAQNKDISKFNIKANLHIMTSYAVPGNLGAARHVQNGQLFACFLLSDTVITKDTAAGRLVMEKVTSVLLMPLSKKRGLGLSQGNKEKVYEALVEDRTRECMLLRLSKECCEDLKLRPERDIEVELQFQLNRLPLCEMHLALDNLKDCSLVSPDISSLLSLNLPSREWEELLDPRLNCRQREAAGAITAPATFLLPPILLMGPCGTGKTFTLAQAIKHLMKKSDKRILFCTHSDTAADSFLKDYLSPIVEHDASDIRLLRIYHKNKSVKSVQPTVQRYCLLARNQSSFVLPRKEDVLKCRIVVTTVSSAKYLCQADLQHGYFTHILLDDASQAVECETIMALGLADRTTRIVLAGDPMQLNPVVYSEFARERNLHISLIERLSQLYPADSCCHVSLSEQYRSHEAIISLASELFYRGSLIASSKHPAHKDFFPLTFFVAWGADVQDRSSCSYYNCAEVLEVAEQVEELQKKWPVAWGKLDENSIGMVTPYANQAMRIRAELQKKKLTDVTVEQILNIQDTQFRVLFVSTVRTRHTYKEPQNSARRKEAQQEESTEDLEYGFLSSYRMLNTVLTRAQSLVAVVGDPVALCSMGKCRKIWERFIFLCHEHGSLHGATLSEIRTQLDNLELSRSCMLNPLAPEFIPRAIQNFAASASRLQASPAKVCAQVTWSGYQNRLALDPRLVARQATVAYNLSLLQPHGRLSPGPYSVDTSSQDLEHSKSGRERMTSRSDVGSFWAPGRKNTDVREKVQAGAVWFSDHSMNMGSTVKYSPSHHHVHEQMYTSQQSFCLQSIQPSNRPFSHQNLGSPQKRFSIPQLSPGQLSGHDRYVQTQTSLPPTFENSSRSQLSPHLGLHHQFPASTSSLTNLSKHHAAQRLHFLHAADGDRIFHGQALLGTANSLLKADVQKTNRFHSRLGQWTEHGSSHPVHELVSCGIALHSSNAHKALLQEYRTSKFSLQSPYSQMGELYGDIPIFPHKSTEQPSAWNLPLSPELSEIPPQSRLLQYCQTQLHSTAPQNMPHFCDQIMKDPRKYPQHGLYPFPSAELPPNSCHPFHVQPPPFADYSQCSHTPLQHQYRRPHSPDSLEDYRRPHSPEGLDDHTLEPLGPSPNTSSSVLNSEAYPSLHYQQQSDRSYRSGLSPKSFQAVSESEVRVSGRPLYQRQSAPSPQEASSVESSRGPSPYCSPSQRLSPVAAGQLPVGDLEEETYNPISCYSAQSPSLSPEGVLYNGHLVPGQNSPSVEAEEIASCNGSSSVLTPPGPPTKALHFQSPPKCSEAKHLVSYASVVRAAPKARLQSPSEPDRKPVDPISILQDLSKRSSLNDSGYYSYFQ